MFYNVSSNDTPLTRHIKAYYKTRRTHPNLSAMGKLIVMFMCFIPLRSVGFACQLLGKFDMRDMFKKGEIMIGGIFPIFNKQENILASFENKPSNGECKG